MSALANCARRCARKAALLILVLVPTLLVWPGHAGLSTAQNVDLNRAQVIRDLFAAQGRGDVDGALATFANNAVFVTSFRAGVCLASSPCTDSDSIHAQLVANQALGHFCPTLTSIEVAGTTVMGQVETRTDTYRAEGVEHILSSFIAQVPQSQITALYFVRNLGDSGSALEAAIAAGSQTPGATLPAPTTPCA